MILKGRVETRFCPISGPDGVVQDTVFYYSTDALDLVARIVEGMVANNCRPIFRRHEDGIVQGWDFENLLGAMWLQMMWLVSAGGEVRRCARPGCNRPITIKSPDHADLLYTEARHKGKKRNVPKKYKTRKDKAYCSPSCRVLAHRQRTKDASAV